MSDPDEGGGSPEREMPASGAGQPVHAEPRRLRRCKPAEIGGVAGGLARYVGVDPRFFRIAFVIMTVIGGSGLVVYLAAWLLLPDDDDPDPQPLALTSNVAGLAAGFVVLAVGALSAIEGDTWGIGPGIVIPVVMVLIGLWLLNQRAESTAPAGLPPPPPHRGNWPPAGPQVAVDPSPPRDPRSGQPPPPPESSPLDRLPTTTAPAPGGFAPAGPGAGGGPPPWDTPAPTQPWAVPHGEASVPGPAGPPITSITLAAVAVAGGVFLVLHNVGGIGISATLVVGAVLAIIGAGLVASAFTDRAVALYPLGLLALAVLWVAPLIDTTLTGGVGTRQIRVVSPEGLESSYSLGMGELLIDLGDLELTESAEVDVDVGAGYAEIQVPGDVRVEVRAASRAGYVEVFELADEGLRNEIRYVRGPEPGPGDEPDDPGDPPTLRIDASVTFGYVEVRRG